MLYLSSLNSRGTVCALKVLALVYTLVCALILVQLPLTVSAKPQQKKGVTQKKTAPPTRPQEILKKPPTTEQIMPDGSPAKPSVTDGTGAINPTNIDPNANPQQLNIPPYQPQPVPPTPSLERLGVKSGNALPLSLQDAVRLALVNNNNIEVARDDVRFAETQLKAAQGIYDPLLNINPQYSNSVDPLENQLSGAGNSGTIRSSSITGDANITQFVPFYGGQYQLTFNNSRLTSTSTFQTFNPQFDSSLGISYIQPLMRNFLIDGNRREIRVQKKILAQTDADFRLQTIEVINNVQQAYWELVFALRDQENNIENLNLSHENFKQTEARIAAGASAPLERAQVQTEVSNRESDLLLSTQNLSVAENNLKQLILKSALAPEWSAQIMPTDQPTYSNTPVNLEDVLKEARANRPELSRLRLQQDINQIDLDFFHNQTRPQIDLTASYTTSGLAGTPVDPLDPTIVPGLVGGYGTALGNLFNFDTRTIAFGLTIQIPLRNRTATANYAGAKVQKEQIEANIRAQEQTVEVDVRAAAQAVETSRLRVQSARVARESAEQQLEGERKLYQVGRSTLFLVFQRENELAAARNQEIRAQVDYNQAIAQLQRATSTSLHAYNVVIQSPLTK